MVAVPTLAHGWNCKPGYIVTLNGGVFDEPVLMAAPMRNVGDIPVHCEADRDPNDYAPYNPRPAAKPEQSKRDGDLVQHPGTLKEYVERIVADAWPRIKLRRLIEQELEIKIVESVDQHGLAVAEEPVAIGLALSPVADVVKADSPQWTTHSDQYANIDHRSFEPLRTIEATVDQSAVKPHGMANAQGKTRQGQEHNKTAPAEKHRAQDHRARDERHVPD